MNVNFTVEYSVGAQTFRQRASKLSGGGLFIDGPMLFPVETELALCFRPAKHLPLMKTKARICYQIVGQGSAVEFTDISPTHRQMLLRLIHHKTADKRRLPRAPLATQIECKDFMGLAFSRDVSLGGMFIETMQVLPVQSQLDLRFNLGDNGPVVVTRAEVMYEVVKLGMGVQFIDLSPADRKRIETYVANASAVPIPAPATTGLRH